MFISTIKLLPGPDPQIAMIFIVVPFMSRARPITLARNVVNNRIKELNQKLSIMVLMSSGIRLM